MNGEQAALELPEGFTVGEEDLEDGMDTEMDEEHQTLVEEEAMTAEDLSLYHEQMAMVDQSRMNVGGKEDNLMHDSDEEMMDA
jgi:hypothetical protein